MEDIKFAKRSPNRPKPTKEDFEKAKLEARRIHEEMRKQNELMEHLTPDDWRTIVR